MAAAGDCRGFSFTSLVLLTSLKEEIDEIVDESMHSLSSRYGVGDWDTSCHALSLWLTGLTALDSSPVRLGMFALSFSIPRSTFAF